MPVAPVQAVEVGVQAAKSYQVMTRYSPLCCIRVGAMGLHLPVGGRTGPGYSLLHFDWQGKKIKIAYHKCCHIMLYLQLMEPNCHSEVVPSLEISILA